MTMKNVNNQKLCQIISYFLWISHFPPLELIFSSFSSMAYFFSVLIFNFFNVSLYFLYLHPYFCPHDQINKIICEQIIFPWVLLSKCFPSDVCFHLDSCPQACSMALTVDILSWFLCWTHCVRELFLCLLPHFPRTRDPRFTKSCSSWSLCVRHLVCLKMFLLCLHTSLIILLGI